jgi:hypothetical protein
MVQSRPFGRELAQVKVPGMSPIREEFGARPPSRLLKK